MTRRADDKTRSLLSRLDRAGVTSATFDDAHILRRAELTLHRWSEQECGDSNDYASWAIVRDETTDVPYREIHPHTGKSRRVRIPDLERGALRRVADVCARLGLHYYYQADPRGCSLYVSADPLHGVDYYRGIGCAER